MVVSFDNCCTAAGAQTYSHQFSQREAVNILPRKGRERGRDRERKSERWMAQFLIDKKMEYTAGVHATVLATLFALCHLAGPVEHSGGLPPKSSYPVKKHNIFTHFISLLSLHCKGTFFLFVFIYAQVACWLPLLFAPGTLFFVSTSPMNSCFAVMSNRDPPPLSSTDHFKCGSVAASVERREPGVLKS